jgi:hypothetical protein
MLKDIKSGSKSASFWNQECVIVKMQRQDPKREHDSSQQKVNKIQKYNKFTVKKQVDMRVSRRRRA